MGWIRWVIPALLGAIALRLGPALYEPGSGQGDSRRRGLLARLIGLRGLQL